MVRGGGGGCACRHPGFPVFLCKHASSPSPPHLWNHASPGPSTHPRGRPLPGRRHRRCSGLPAEHRRDVRLAEVRRRPPHHVVVVRVAGGAGGAVQLTLERAGGVQVCGQDVWRGSSSPGGGCRTADPSAGRQGADVWTGCVEGKLITGGGCRTAIPSVGRVRRGESSPKRSG